MNDESKKREWRHAEELTLLELARSCNVPETTARRWVHRFSSYLGGRRDRRGYHFPPAAITTFARIMDGVRAGRGPEEIEGELRATVPQTVETALMTTTTQPLPELTATLSRIAAVLERLELERQGELVKRIEALEEKQAKHAPWWRRIFGKT